MLAHHVEMKLRSHVALVGEANEDARKPGVTSEEIKRHENGPQKRPRLDFETSGSGTLNESTISTQEIDSDKPVPELGADGNSSRTRSALPSIYLRQACPACFGGAARTLKTSRYVSLCISTSKWPSEFDSAHVIVCLDANFTQKCRKKKYDDPACPHPQTHFLSDKEVTDMETHINILRSNPPLTIVEKANKGKVLSDEVLDECEKSFMAATETAMKASKGIHADTGLMALLCRHDRVLWVANITSAGEKQFYAYALVKRIFEHIPETWNVGLLYDIACQIKRSMIKVRMHIGNYIECTKTAQHGILSEVYERLSFAVSVFHAYGHQWPCQLTHHPRKIPGFGLSDGEGCERFWSSNRRLIPSLRVSGVCSI
jgi:hypothetical protein